MEKSFQSQMVYFYTLGKRRHTLHTIGRRSGGRGGGGGAARARARIFASHKCGVTVDVYTLLNTRLSRVAEA